MFLASDPNEEKKKSVKILMIFCLILQTMPIIAKNMVLAVFFLEILMAHLSTQKAFSF